MPQRDKQLLSSFRGLARLVASERSPNSRRDDPESGAAVHQQQLIERFVLDRRIPCLCHFTRAVNLPTILQRGLVPKSITSSWTPTPVYTDDHRFDEHIDAVSLSISFPNDRMFYKKRRAGQLSIWAVVLLDPSILWLQDCAFFPSNAGSRLMKTIPSKNLRGLLALQRLFDGKSLDLKSRDPGIPAWFTTDPQAEVMVHDVVPPSMITEIYFESARERREACEGHPEVMVRAQVDDDYYFARRSDHELWRTDSDVW